MRPSLFFSFSLPKNKEMRRIENIAVLLACALLALSCDKESVEKREKRPEINLREVALLLSALPVENEQVREVHDAARSSSGNGYDEEYTMKDLFALPGSGVGDTAGKAPRQYGRPMKDLIADYLKSATKASGMGTGMSPDDYMAALASSDVQIYWPYSEKWDGREMPVVTFDPGEGYDSNIGYRLAGGTLEEVVVTEETAMTSPVWVVNRNSDSGFSSYEMLRRGNTGGGSIRIKKAAVPDEEGTALKTLVLKSFKAKRSYDPWFSGASEFFVKCGSVEDFYASTEAELKLYSPSITDFMLVVRRGDIGKEMPLDIVLVSEWSEQLESCAFMLTEDDGGSQTSWKCAAEVKVKSKTYGFDVSLPFRTRDDIVWRGQLSGKYLEKYSGKTGHFGDVDLRFDIVE